MLTATTAHNADLITSLIQLLDFVLKSVVMERDTHPVVMTETTMMETDAAKIAELKSDSHVMEDLPTLPTLAAQPFPLPFLSKKEDNHTCMAKSFLTSDSTIFLKIS